MRSNTDEDHDTSHETVPSGTYYSEMVTAKLSSTMAARAVSTLPLDRSMLEAALVGFADADAVGGACVALTVDDVLVKAAVSSGLYGLEQD